MPKLPRGESHKTPHKSPHATTPNSGWSSSFADVTPYTNGATNDSDTEFEPYDIYDNLDISKRDDRAQFTKTPFTITKSQASSRSKSSKASREAEEMSSRELTSEATVFEPKKTLEERLAEQEAADRKGGRSITPAVELPKAKKEDKGSSWSNKGTTGWKNAHGQPVAASKPPHPSKVLSLLDKIDKKSNKVVRKRKAPNPGPTKASAPVSAPVPEFVTAPAPRAPLKSIRERLDDIERETKTKTVIPAAKAQSPEKVVSERGKGKEKKTATSKDDDISFRMLPAGAAPNDKFPIVKGLEKMKSLPQKKKLAPPSPNTSSDIPVPDLDIDELLAEAAAKSDRWRPSNRASRHAPPQHDVQDDEVIEVTRARGQSRRNTGQDDCMDINDNTTFPSLDQSNPTEPTDTYLTPHGTDENRSIGNPSTITHLSETIPHYSDRQSSSSQVPYSSPALDRARREAQAPDRISMLSPRPVRAVSGDVLRLENLAGERYEREKDTKLGGLLKPERFIKGDDRDVRERGDQFMENKYRESKYRESKYRESKCGEDKCGEDKCGQNGYEEDNHGESKYEENKYGEDKHGENGYDNHGEHKHGGSMVERIGERDIKARGNLNQASQTGTAGAMKSRKTLFTNTPRSSGFKAPIPVFKPDQSDRYKRQDRPFSTYDDYDEVKPVEEEWSTLNKGRSRFPKNGQAIRSRDLEPSTPSHKVPLFRQQQGSIAVGSGSKIGSSKFTFRPPPLRDSSSASYSTTYSGTGSGSGREGYRLKPVPNGTKLIASYPAEEMAWTGPEIERAQRASTREDQRRSDEWARQTQREMERKGDARVEEGDWRDAWKAQSKRQVEENPHKQYAFDAKRIKVAGQEYRGRSFL